MTDDGRENGLFIIRDGKRRYLRGTTASRNGDLIWTLPPEDRPNTNLEFPEQDSSEGKAMVRLWGDGGISADVTAEWVSYDGIEFDTDWLGPLSKGSD